MFRTARVIGFGLICAMFAHARTAQAVPLTGGTGPGGFSVADGTSNLRLWLKADTDVFQDTAGASAADTNGQDVARWDDQSGLGTVLDQSTPADRPTFSTGTLNGLPAVSFSSAVEYLDATFSPANGNVGRTIFFVGEPDENVNSAGIIDISADGTTTGNAYAITAEVAIRVSGNQVFDTALSTSAGSVLTVRNREDGTFGDTGDAEAFINGQALTLGINTTETATTTPTAFNPNGTITEVGRLQESASTTLAYEGSITELSVFNRELNDAERTIVENYLSAKYDVALTGTGALDVYSGDDGPTHYDFDVFGVGQRSIGSGRTAGSVLNAGASGMGIEVGSLSDDEFILAGHNTETNGFTAANLSTAPTVNARWVRDWFVDTTDGIAATIAFDFSDGGILGKLNNPTLLYRSTATGEFIDLGLTPLFAGDTVSFMLSGGLLIDGFYTLGGQAVPEPSSWLLLGLGSIALARGRRRRGRSKKNTRPAIATIDHSSRMPKAPVSAWQPNRWRTHCLPATVVLLVSSVGTATSRAATIFYEQTVLADNPVAYWRLGETSGTNAADLSGNGHNGTYTNSPTLGVTGVGPASDFAVDFDGTDDYVVVPDDSDFDFLNHTLEAWIRLESPTETHNRIVSQQGTDYWLLHIQETPASQWRLTHYSSLDGISGTAFGPDLNDGEFHHVAITRDTVADLVTWYVDGANVGSVVTNDDTAFSIAASVYIGAFNGGDQFFPGVIDEVALYGTALSGTTIAEHFAAGTSLPPPPIPEPSTIILAGFGMLGLLSRRKPRRRL